MVFVWNMSTFSINYNSVAVNTDCNSERDFPNNKSAENLNYKVFDKASKKTLLRYCKNM